MIQTRLHPLPLTNRGASKGSGQAKRKLPGAARQAQHSRAHLEELTRCSRRLPLRIDLLGPIALHLHILRPLYMESDFLKGKESHRVSQGKLSPPPEHTHSNHPCTPGTEEKYRTKLNKALGPLMGNSIPGALKEKAEQGTEVPQPHRSCRAQLQRVRDKCQQVMTGTIPCQGCPSAHCSSPGADPLSSTARGSSPGLPHWNGSSTALPQLPPRHPSTLWAQQHPAPALHRHWHNCSPTTAPAREHSEPAQAKNAESSTWLSSKCSKSRACSAPSPAGAQGFKRGMPREFSAASAAQMKGSSGSDSPAPAWLPSCP